MRGERERETQRQRGRGKRGGREREEGREEAREGEREKCGRSNHCLDSRAHYLLPPRPPNCAKEKETEFRN